MTEIPQIPGVLFAAIVITLALRYVFVPVLQSILIACVNLSNYIFWWRVSRGDYPEPYRPLGQERKAENFPHYKIGDKQ